MGCSRNRGASASDVVDVFDKLEKDEVFVLVCVLPLCYTQKTPCEYWIQFNYTETPVQSSHTTIHDLIKPAEAPAARKQKTVQQVNNTWM